MTIFCHFNGYPEENGAMLVEHYNTSEQVDALLALGDLYYLREKITPCSGAPHEHGNAQPGVTIAYQRDEGCTGCEAAIQTLEEINDSGSDGIEYTYIFSLNGQWLYFPTGETEFGIHNVKEDLDANEVRYGTFYSGFSDDLDLVGDETEKPENNISLTQI